MSNVTEPTGTVSRELALLLCCGRRALADEQRERLGALLDEDISWEEVLALGRRHRLTPLLFHHLNAFQPDRVPAWALQSLREAFNQNARRSLLLSAELRDVLSRFRQAGIGALPYKGPVLAQQLYGNVALREMSDLDVLVHPRDMITARDLLLAHGYFSLPARVGIPDKLALKWDCNLILVRDPNRQIFELHWAIAGNRYTFPLDFDEAWTRARHVQLAGTSLPTFATEDLLLILCFHGSRHMWQCIEWIVGVAELIRSEAIDWDELFRRAERLRCRRRLLLGLQLAVELVDAPVPEHVLRRGNGWPPARVLESVRTVLFVSDGPAISVGRRFHKFQVAVSDGIRSKTRYLFRVALEPAKEDYFALPLPSALYPLYPLIRPFRLAGTYGARRARGKP